MIHLDNENLMSMRVHPGIDVAGTEVMRIRHAVCLDPADSAWISE